MAVSFLYMFSIVNWLWLKNENEWIKYSQQVWFFVRHWKRNGIIGIHLTVTLVIIFQRWVKVFDLSFSVVWLLVQSSLLCTKSKWWEFIDFLSLSLSIQHRTLFWVDLPVMQVDAVYSSSLGIWFIFFFFSFVWATFSVLFIIKMA